MIVIGGFLVHRKGIAMKKYLKPMIGFLVISFCIFMGCEKKEGKGQILEPVQLLDVEEAEPEQDTETDAVQESGEEDPAEDAVCVVHICGAVQNPGVYTLESGKRIYQAIEAAGGFTGDAGEDYLNQADPISDGMKIYVPTLEEIEGTRWQEIADQTVSDEGKGLVNINTADEELLCTLSGVGSSRAKSIIEYREKHGAYQKIEDIMNVEGIKDGLFQKIKDSITV